MTKGIGTLVLFGVISFIFYKGIEKPDYKDYNSTQEPPTSMEPKDNTPDSMIPLEDRKIEKFYKALPYEEREILKTRNGKIEYSSKDLKEDSKSFEREEINNQFYKRNQFTTDPIYDVETNRKGQRIYRIKD